MRPVSEMSRCDKDRHGVSSRSSSFLSPLIGPIHDQPHVARETHILELFVHDLRDTLIAASAGTGSNEGKSYGHKSMNFCKLEAERVALRMDLSDDLHRRLMPAT